ncbi:NADH-quinone oxidoreductase subunit K [Thermococci archaeon]|nr:MAG: NADH-quinone oxidoreductase subunit K [Thermococci archaeon]
MLGFSAYLACAIILYIIGLYCLVTKRNLVRLVMGLEILINAAHINFIALSAYWVPGFIDPLARSTVMISIGLAGCVGAVLLSFTVYAYRHYGTLDVRRMRELRG